MGCVLKHLHSAKNAQRFFPNSKIHKQYFCLTLHMHGEQTVVTSIASV